MSKRSILVSGAVVAIGVVAVVAIWFQPQKLWIDERVDEALPTAPTTPTAGSSATPAELATGEFASIDHATSGVTRVLRLEDGMRIVRLEGFATENGPDLFVYLSSNAADGAEEAFDDDIVNLGRLKGNQGDQNYDLPADVDLDRFRSVVIWCDRFNAAFGAAPLA